MLLWIMAHETSNQSASFQSWVGTLGWNLFMNSAPVKYLQMTVESWKMIVTGLNGWA